MANSSYDDPFFPLTPITLAKLLDPPSIDKFEDIATTPSGSNPSNTGSSSSPPHSTAALDDVFMAELETIIDNIDSKFSASNTDPLSDPSGAVSIEVPLKDYQNEKLHIIAQPKALYRGRYPSETDKDKNRAKRFIRAENNDEKYEYPTIKIPAWCHQKQPLYIRVTLVTVISARVPYHCIHPYEIDTSEQNVIYRDKINNSLYFVINENEVHTGEKSFRIIIKKKKQDELKSHDPMRLFDHEQYENINIENPQDPKQKILLYQLWASQFVFTIAERQENCSLPIPWHHTSIESQTMIDDTVTTHNPPTDYPSSTSVYEVKCTPQTGNWAGGDEVLIIMPNPIRRKEYKIDFDFGEFGQQSINEISQVDTKTILFRTPPCPFKQSNTNFQAWITIQENNIFIQRTHFIYLTSRILIRNICPFCQMMTTNSNMNNKRRYQSDEEFDSGISLASQMSQLSIETKTIELHSHASSSTSIDKQELKFEKYLNQLKDALEIFVRTNDPSRVFRRTRILLSRYHGNSSPLHDAIQCGHTQLALALIEQIIDMPSPNRLLENENDDGETPLLVAAKLNEWKLIECILKSRSDLAKQKDKDGNNLLHLLANLSEDKGVKTIENVLAILPDEVKVNLLKEQNQKNQTPIEIAQLHNNTFGLELLIDLKNKSE